MKYYHIKPEHLTEWGDHTDENTVIDDTELERLSTEWGIPAADLLEDLEEYNPTYKEEKTMEKRFLIDDHEIILSEITFRFADESNYQTGILLHDGTDVNSDGDTIFGNAWILDMINDTDDVRNLLSSTGGTTYFTRNDDGTYHIEA